MNDKLHIRTAQISDAEELLAIYKPYIENTAITFEYDVPSIEEFANRIKTTLKKYRYLQRIRRCNRHPYSEDGNGCKVTFGNAPDED